MSSEPMNSEWLKVMLEEIARKRAEADAGLREEARRHEETQPREERQSREESGRASPTPKPGAAVC